MTYRRICSVDCGYCNVCVERENILQNIRARQYEIVNQTVRENSNDYYVVRGIIVNYGVALQYASPQLRNNEEIVSLACSSSNYAFIYASDELKNNREFVRKICQTNICCIMSASDEILKDVKFVKNIVKIKSDDDKYIYNTLACIISNISPITTGGLLYQPHITDEMKNRLLSKTSMKSKQYIEQEIQRLNHKSKCTRLKMINQCLTQVFPYEISCLIAWFAMDQDDLMRTVYHIVHEK